MKVSSIHYEADNNLCKYRNEECKYQQNSKLCKMD